MHASEIDTACQIVALAFADNPNTLAAARGNRQKAQRMMRSAVRLAKLARTCSYVMVAEQGNRLVGVLNAAQWPDCQLRLAEKIRLAPAMLRVMGSSLPRQLRITSAWARRDPRQSHWHVGPIGVLPELQGLGVGKALLGSFLAIADEQECPAYLETDVDRNVMLYERFGFKVIASEQILGVNNRFMWRQSTTSPGILHTPCASANK